MLTVVLRRAVLLPVVFSLLSLSARAEDTTANALPEGVVRMITAAHARGDAALVDQVVSLARETQPDAGAQIDALLASLSGDAVPAAEKAPVVAENTAPAKPKKAALKVQPVDPGLFSLPAWHATLELGVGVTTGDTRDQSLAFAFKGNRTFDELWKHRLGLKGAYGRSDGDTDQQNATFDYQLDYLGWKRTFVFGALRAAHDRFGAYDYRIAGNVGIGYTVIERDGFAWAVQTGPGVQYQRIDANGTETDYNLMVGSDLTWSISDTVDLTNNSRGYLGTSSQVFENELALVSQLSSSLAGRFSVQVDYEPDAPAGGKALSTDTRATLLYKF